MTDTSTLLWAGAAGALVAGAVSFSMSSAAPSVSTSSPADTRALLARLSAQDERIAALSEQLAALQSSIAIEPTTADVATAAAIVESDDADSPASNTASPARRRDNTPPTVSELVAAGFAPDRAEAMLTRLDELALERLRLTHAAGQTKDSDERRRLQTARAQLGRDASVIREEFGDDDYDRFLYASGRSNRVKVRDVLRGSAAADVDMQPGDLLVSLDGDRLFGIRDLISRTRNSPASESFPLVIERNGQRFETYVPGGPLGVRVEGERSQPSSG